MMELVLIIILQMVKKVVENMCMTGREIADIKKEELLETYFNKLINLKTGNQTCSNRAVQMNTWVGFCKDALQGLLEYRFLYVLLCGGKGHTRHIGK